MSRKPKAYAAIKEMLTTPPFYTMAEIAEQTGFALSTITAVRERMEDEGVQYAWRDRWNRLRCYCPKAPAEKPKSEKPMMYTDVLIGARYGIAGRFADFRIVAVDSRLDVIRATDTTNANETLSVSLRDVRQIELTDIVLTAEYGEGDKGWRTPAGVVAKSQEGGYSLLHKGERTLIRHLHELDYFVNKQQPIYL